MSGEIRLAFFLSVCHRNLLQTNQNSKKLKYKNYACLLYTSSPSLRNFYIAIMKYFFVN